MLCARRQHFFLGGISTVSESLPKDNNQNYISSSNDSTWECRYTHQVTTLVSELILYPSDTRPRVCSEATLLVASTDLLDICPDNFPIVPPEPKEDLPLAWGSSSSFSFLWEACDFSSPDMGGWFHIMPRTQKKWKKIWTSVTKKVHGWAMTVISGPPSRQQE